MERYKIKGRLDVKLEVLVQVKDAVLLWQNGCFGSMGGGEERRVEEVERVTSSAARLLYGTLSLYEAVFLMRQEGRMKQTGQECFQLSLIDWQGEEVSLRRVENLARSRYGEGWLRRMAVYEDLKERGWVVQSGLNYGMDWLLYGDSPDQEHASEAVVVRTSPSEMCWREVIALNRIACTVRKSLLIALVQLDGDVADGDNYDAPSAKAIIRYLRISRWLPEVCRFNHAGTDEEGEKEEEKGIIYKGKGRLLKKQ